jgi:RnfABCDGE-type electron transport complex G subunit
MSDVVRYPLVLGAITLCSAAGLALSYSLTRDEIRYQQQLKKDRGLAEVFGIELDESPGAQRPWRRTTATDELGTEFSVFEANDPDSGGRLYAAEGKAQGYSSKVAVVVAVGGAVAERPASARINAVKVVEQLETPGLGSRCTEPEFQRQFRRLLLGRLKLEKNVPPRDPAADGGDERCVAAITGATITSEAVLTAVRQAVERARRRAAQADRDTPKAP